MAKSGRARIRSGTEFEDRFEDYCLDQPETDFIKIERGCLWLPDKKFLPVPQAFDGMVFFRDKMIFLDLKTILDNHYPLMSTEKMAKKTSHQVQHLFRAHARGHAAGYLCEFQSSFEIRWYPVTLVAKLMLTKKTLSLVDGYKVGETFPPHIDFDKILSLK